MSEESPIIFDDEVVNDYNNEDFFITDDDINNSTTKQENNKNVLIQNEEEEDLTNNKPLIDEEIETNTNEEIEQEIEEQKPLENVEEKKKSKKKSKKKKTKEQPKEIKEDSEEVEYITFEEYSQNVTSTITPVAITLLLTVIVVKLLTKSNGYFSQVNYVFSETLETSETIPAWLIGVIVAVIFIIMIVVVTFVFVLLFYFRCMKFIIGWLMLSVVLLLILFGGMISANILESFNWPIDWISFGIVIFNFGICGIISIFYLSPMKLNQFYMIIISVFMATVFTNLPEWTTWALLVGMALYDLAAVLCPKGPLKMLVNLAQERNEPIPALVYSTAVWMGMVEEMKENEKTDIIGKDYNRFTLSERHGRGIKLGLGDFVFYSVLVGRCALYDLTIVFSASIAVLSGLFGTLILLVVCNKALPALPISIFFGTFIYVISRWAIVPLVTTADINGFII